MAMTEQDARALTHLVKRIRQDLHGACEWDENGIWAELRRLVGRDLLDTIEAVTRHAGDTTAKTPGAIRRPFVPARAERRPNTSNPTAATACATCGRTFTADCCDRPTRRPASTPPPEGWAAEIRAQLRQEIP